MCERRGGNGGVDKFCHFGKGGTHPSFIWRGNYGVGWKSLKGSQVKYPCTYTQYHSFLLIISSLLGTGINPYDKISLVSEDDGIETKNIVQKRQLCGVKYVSTHLMM